VPSGSVDALLAGHRRELFTHARFADQRFSPRGRPSVLADVLAAVLVLRVWRATQIGEAKRR
jgi:hypothetical protein